MAVYVLLTFDNDGEAKKFVENVLRDGEVGSKQGDLISSDLEWAETSVRGVWKKPTIFCTCVSSDRKVGFTRGRKYGWWVHAGCGKPSKLWAQGNAWCTALGVNLLPQSEIAPEYRPPGGEVVPLWQLPTELLNPSGEMTFINDDDIEIVRSMLPKAHSHYGPLYKGVVRSNPI
jgi:hypothetical protein